MTLCFAGCTLTAFMSLLCTYLRWMKTAVALSKKNPAGAVKWLACGYVTTSQYSFNPSGLMVVCILLFTAVSSSCLLRAHVTMMIDKQRFCRILSRFSLALYVVVVVLVVAPFPSLSYDGYITKHARPRTFVRSSSVGSWTFAFATFLGCCFIFFSRLCWLRLRVVQLCPLLHRRGGFRFWNKMAVEVVAWLAFPVLNFFVDFFLICVLKTLKSYCVCDWIWLKSGAVAENLKCIDLKELNSVWG